MIRPIFTIVRTFTTLIMRSTGLNRTVTATLVNNIFLMSSIVYQRYGFITTIQSITSIFNFLRNNNANISSIFLNRRIINNHPELRSLILQYISPNWTTMLEYKKRFLFILFSTFISSILALIRPIWFIRFSSGIIISSLGILWHETLSSIDYLRKGSLFIINLLETYGFNLPIPSLRDIKEETDNYLTPSVYTALGIILLGTFGIALSIILLEWVIPPIKTPEPIGYLDRLYIWLHLESFFYKLDLFNLGMYQHYPGLYDYFLSPMKNYFFNPIWKYTISYPFSFGYDWIYHPLADGMRNTYDFIINYFFNGGNSGNGGPNPPGSMLNSPISSHNSDIELDDMSSSTDTIRPNSVSMSRSNNNSSIEGLFTKAKNSFVGFRDASSSKVKLEDMPDITNNPFI